MYAKLTGAPSISIGLEKIVNWSQTLEGEFAGIVCVADNLTHPSLVEIFVLPVGWSAISLAVPSLMSVYLKLGHIATSTAGLPFTSPTILTSYSTL